MSTAPRITGTFLDEITHDIPSQNWGRNEWDREFRLYKSIGLDTVIIIRAGYGPKCIFPSRVIPGLLPVYEDLGDVFFTLADQHGLNVFFGTYDSGFHWMRGAWWDEVDLNKAFIDEAVERYGHHASFKGRYLCHETSRNGSNIIELFNHIGRHCREAKDLPVLISPFPQGAKQFSGGDVMSLQESLNHWNRIFSETEGAFTTCAFQDGQVHYEELPNFHAGILELGQRYGVEIWSNVETFDRDMPIKFPPADWRYLRLKLEAAAASVSKIITFEFPHFVSPYSAYPAAHNLFNRYRDYLGEAWDPS